MPMACKGRDVVGKILQHLDHDVLLTGIGFCCRCCRHHETHTTVLNNLLCGSAPPVFVVLRARHGPAHQGAAPCVRSDPVLEQS
jgi:hypothetical protein